MTRHSYRERNYVFGQVMLKLRSSIGLTQAGLANLLGVFRRAVGEWEGGLNYPKAEHLQHFLALCVQVRLIRVLLRAPSPTSPTHDTATALDFHGSQAETGGKGYESTSPAVHRRWVLPAAIAGVRCR